ncbi:hypothetical protein EIP86_010723 [Pleurotus ostreatoroseus]|nr:hypothetical protein EIP86_010723 [Pleurotus ostreatoroseus]
MSKGKRDSEEEIKVNGEDVPVVAKPRFMGANVATRADDMCSKTSFTTTTVTKSSTLAVFLSLRLVTLVRTDGPRTGISEWTKETKARLIQDGTTASPIQSDVATAKCDDDDDDSDSNVSVGSTVVVNGATDSGVSGNESPVLVKEEHE